MWGIMICVGGQAFNMFIFIIINALLFCTIVMFVCMSPPLPFPLLPSPSLSQECRLHCGGDAHMPPSPVRPRTHGGHVSDCNTDTDGPSQPPPSLLRTCGEFPVKVLCKVCPWAGRALSWHLYVVMTSVC